MYCTYIDDDDDDDDGDLKMTMMVMIMMMVMESWSLLCCSERIEGLKSPGGCSS